MTFEQTSHHPVEKIRFGEAMNMAFAPLFSNFKTAVKFTLLPAISLLIIMGISTYLISVLAPDSTSLETEIFPLFFVVQLFFLLVTSLIFFQFYAAWVRFTFLDEDAISETLFLKLSKRHFLLAGKGLLLGIGSYIAFIVVIALFVIAGFILFFGMESFSLEAESYSPSMIGGMIFLIFPIMLILMAIFSAIVLKLSYVFPATALDQPYSFSMSWAHTRKQGLHIFLAFFVLYFIMSFAAGFIISIVIGVFSIALFSSSDVLQASDPATMLTSTSTLFLVIPLYFGVTILSLLAMIPFINMHNYCFATNTGWQSTEEITERFA
ncbi:hypothetical protein WH96_03665 [Kiloniella spongiae]|uniref:Glycerophosphoryl diester phosphodiesterase membrane domain-containing protein n=1 Tax=Kiloniella spongiae TaxID=1489064 RepID=A0A0H2MP77_9PROT|nr:hypothetical protein [Kiloniella spongiae]KLN62577.1 hypothetical protein WH96_03665 [Kiloniella spongiae]